jgi:hypothetical protein
MNFGEGILNGAPKSSPLDDTPKHLIVLCDWDSGVIALFHQEYFITHKKELVKD